MSTYLAPVASTSTLPPSQPLALLPFALGSSQIPYKTSASSISQYFQPRPCPADITGIPEGTSIASFRGRQLVGHTITIPSGYRGLVINAPEPHTIETKWPLTPAPSVTTTETSAEVSSNRRSPRKSTLANVASTIKAKVRGAGQVALSRPKTRQAKTNTIRRKRYELDSDDEEDQGHIEQASTSTLVDEMKTPRKRTRSGTIAQAVRSEDLPTIVVQEATPLKEPLPTPKKRLGTSASMERLPGASRRSVSPSPAATEVSVSTSEPSEQVIPSPATEDDPPVFPVDPTPNHASNAQMEQPVVKNEVILSSTASPSTDTVKTESDPPQEEIEGEYTNARVLRPASTFNSFTLWTPDGPLPGFKQDETEEDSKDEDEAGVKLRKGWWRTGGAGEGGDEIVRALGEWIGLVEELNNPVYLDDKDDSDDE